ncbi:MAG: hypothetical protein JNL38_26865 [Myxococcales bacterium]|jgi:hypothetical protein|nr:hypothetical protein [Myxococcales bacterium]
MGIVGDKPESGLRLHVEREARNVDAPYRYRGTLAAPEDSWAVEAEIAAGGATRVDLAPSAGGAPAPPDAAERVRLILRTALRQADGGPPPRKIVRWRGEK